MHFVRKKMKHSILTTTWVVVTYDVFFLIVKELATHPTHRNFDEIDFIRIATYDVLPVATCTCDALLREIGGWILKCILEELKAS